MLSIKTAIKVKTPKTLIKFMFFSLLKNTIITKEEKKINSCVIVTILSILFSATKLKLIQKL